MAKQISLSLSSYICVYSLIVASLPLTTTSEYFRILHTIQSSILPATSLDPAFLQSLCFRRSCNTITTSAASPALWLRFSRFTCLPGRLAWERLKVDHVILLLYLIFFFGLTIISCSICLHHQGFPLISPAPAWLLHFATVQDRNPLRDVTRLAPTRLARVSGFINHSSMLLMLYINNMMMVDN